MPPWPTHRHPPMPLLGTNDTAGEAGAAATTIHVVVEATIDRRRPSSTRGVVAEEEAAVVAEEGAVGEAEAAVFDDEIPVGHMAIVTTATATTPTATGDGRIGTLLRQQQTIDQLLLNRQNHPRVRVWTVGTKAEKYPCRQHPRRRRLPDQEMMSDHQEMT